MDNAREILEIEEKYKKLLMSKLAGDDRLNISCPEFRYPEPLFVYVKSVRTEKTIAIRLDGGDKTMRFWDYVDDDYSNEDGVWGNMTEKGLDAFIKKLYAVMDKAFDIEYYDLDGGCDDYFSGVANFELNAENAKRAVKKFGKEVEFVFAKFSNFFGDVQYVFDKTFKQISNK